MGLMQRLNQRGRTTKWGSWQQAFFCAWRLGMPAAVHGAFADDTVAAQRHPPVSSRSGNFPAAAERLYGKVSGAQVKVKVEQNLEKLLSPELKSEFDAWRALAGMWAGRRRRPGLSGAGAQGDRAATGRLRFGRAAGEVNGILAMRPVRNRARVVRGWRVAGQRQWTARRWAGCSMGARRPRSPAPASQYAGAVAAVFPGRATSHDPDAAVRARALLHYAEALRNGQPGEVYGVAYDSEGDVLVPAILLLDVKEHGKKGRGGDVCPTAPRRRRRCWAPMRCARG